VTRLLIATATIVALLFPALADDITIPKSDSLLAPITAIAPPDVATFGQRFAQSPPTILAQPGTVNSLPVGTTTVPGGMVNTAPPATQNTITTTAPVSSNTTISVGTLAGQVLSWVMVAFSGPIGGLAVWIMVRVLNNLGITATDALRARMKEFVINGLNATAPFVQAQLVGRGQVEIKNEVVAQTVAYVQAHGAETIKKLGQDPMSQAAVEAIKARIETAIADPTVPTPAVLDPAVPKAA
jgi:hypothetical protein